MQAVSRAVPALVAIVLLTTLSVHGNWQVESGIATSTTPTNIDRAFQRLYSFDFVGAFRELDAAAQSHPGLSLVDSVRAAALHFREMARLHILETDFFMNDSNMIDGAKGAKPDPQVRVELLRTIESARSRAAQQLARNPNDVDALLAMCMAAGVETDYTALVERRTWRSSRLVPNTLKYADLLLAMQPPFYDAYLNVGAVEYIVGDLPFYVRWFVRYDGIQGSKSKGVDQLRLAAAHGRYYGPYARVLLVLVALREKKPADADQLLRGLAAEFPENPLFTRELTRLQARGASRAR